MKNLYKIKDELYIIDNNEKVTQNGTWGKCSFTGDILKNRNGQYAYKVILTTNKLLIKDGVQAIDNEFLEWFVKNPSCESVEVKPYCEKLTCKNKDCNVCCQELKYKIIIPSEGFCDNCNNDICCCIIKKQETLEEAAERLYPKTIASIFTKRDKVDINKERRDIFIESGKFISERMYSEEDMINFAWFLKENLGQYSCDKTAHFKGEYLEQFKKK